MPANREVLFLHMASGGETEEALCPFRQGRAVALAVAVVVVMIVVVIMVLMTFGRLGDIGV